MRNGGYGLRVYGFASTDRTAKSARRAPRRDRCAAASSSTTRSFEAIAPSAPKSFPVATRMSSTVTSVASNGCRIGIRHRTVKIPVRPQ